MNFITIAQMFLSLALSLTVSAQNPQTTPELRRQALETARQTVAFASNLAVRESAQESRGADWPDFQKMQNGVYMNSRGERIQFRDGKYQSPDEAMELMPEYISFGDLNRDNFEDAVVILKTSRNGHSPEYQIAPLINLGGAMTQVSRIELGRELTVYSHQVDGGYFDFEFQTSAESRKVVRYEWKGLGLVKVN